MVLSTDRHFIPRLVREAIEIQKHWNFNREDGFKLANTWNTIVELYKPKQSRNKAGVKNDVVSVCLRDNSRNEVKKI